MNDSVELVQLWEGGPYWADRNIGAENPWDSGYYFWWGDTVGYKRANDKWVASDGSNSDFMFEDINAPIYDKDVSEVNESWITENGVLVPEHDAAQKHWGGNWRMPTKEELESLKRNCNWKWVNIKGVNGCVVSGRGEYASKSIFLPCAGNGHGTSLNAAGSYGGYWSSVLDADFSYYAWILYFDSSFDLLSYQRRDYGWFIHPYMNSNYRNYGRPVRPLQAFIK